MVPRISDELRKKMGNASESVVIVEATAILYGIKFWQANLRYPEIDLGRGFIRNQDATVWELRMAELVAEENREMVRKEKKALAARAEATKGSITTMSDEDKKAALERAKQPK